MELILILIIGIVVGTMIDKKYPEAVKKHFASPSDGTIELNWGGRQFFLLFSKEASERWYEARAHMNGGFFLSLACAFGLIYYVRFEYNIENHDDRIVYNKVVYHGFRDYKELLALAKKDIPVQKELLKNKGAGYFYQMFVAGHNVVMDFMNEY